MSMRNACLTVWAHTEKPSAVPIDDEVIRYAVWQREKCPDTGKQHLQMYAEAYKPLTLKQWKAAVGDSTAHVEKRRGTREEAVAYCRKDESRDEEAPHEFGECRTNQGRRSDIEEKEKRIAVTLSAMLKYATLDLFLHSDDYPPHAIFYTMNKATLEVLWQAEQNRVARQRKAQWWQDKPLYQWQQQVVDLCVDSEADDRHILWLYSPEGNRGKSRVCDFLCTFHGAIEIGGKADACRFFYTGQPIVIFDISASQQEYVSALFAVAEQLKNGRVFSSKYVSVVKEFVPPHVLFIANFPVPEGAWKENRAIELRVPVRDHLYCDACTV